LHPYLNQKQQSSVVKVKKDGLVVAQSQKAEKIEQFKGNGSAEGKTSNGS
jgi:hypothetical protein